ncbi:RNA-binding protein [bacterium]|nr:RNA-binding protein [bacterium]
MSIQIYAGNLAYKMTEDGLRKLFEEYGNVTFVKIVKDRDTNQSKGYGFIEMSDQNDADSAIEALNGTEVLGRTIKVNIARPKTTR